MQVIDFLFDLVEGLKGEAYMFSEFEASVLFPCLVEKVGLTSSLQRILFMVIGHFHVDILRLFCEFEILHFS